VLVVEPRTGATPAAALGRAALKATGDVLCFVDRERAPAPAAGWLDRLGDALGGSVVAATPTLLHPDREGWQRTEHDLCVRTAGYDVELDDTGAPRITARHAGALPDVDTAPGPVVGAPLHGLVVSAEAYRAAGGLDPAATDLDLAALGLCLQLHAQGGQIIHVPSALAFDDRPVRSRRSLEEPFDADAPGWLGLIEQRGPALARRARPVTASRTRWVITTAAPSMRMAPRWGDWHLAQALASALRGLGEEVIVQTHDRANSLAGRSRDIHLVLRGLAPVRRTPGQRHVLWVISHPEAIDQDELDAADLVLVASPRFAAELERETSTPIEVLLQATDHRRFTPRPPQAAHRHPVTVVAKTRDVARPVVLDALAAGLRPAIYGSGWDDVIDPGLVVAERVPNEELPVVYSSAGVVLNDHWDTMRSWGFVSNRVFDVLACGTPIISDDVDGLRDLFGDAVLTYHSPEELGSLVACVLDNPEHARERAARGRARVLASHTFDHRAEALLELLERHHLRDEPGEKKEP
jgi:hypothetical protein